MFINLALDILGTSVACDKVSTDGHEVSNLIHTDYRTRRRGYLAEHFVKPPVHITFSFPCNVNISHVVMEPFIGQQQSMQIELLSAYKNPPRTVHGKLQQKFNVMNSHNSSVESNMPAFHTVSKMTCSTLSPVCFYNPRFTNRTMQSGKSYHDFENKSEMRHSRSQLLNCASHIMVKITRTVKSSTPALNGVEIWGSISSSVSEEVRLVVEQKYIQFVTPENLPGEPSKKIPVKEDGNNRDNNSNKNNNTPEVSDSFEIPEDFLDPITCEVMTIPMLLPCGKNVDKSSLDKFSDSEASHGRRPRDPYTGVEFSGAIKPIPNMDLKARIDAFLMSNSSIKSVSSIPRTLGMGQSNLSRLGKRKRNYDNDVQANVSSLIGWLPKSKDPTGESEKQRIGMDDLGGKNKVCSNSVPRISSHSDNNFDNINSACHSQRKSAKTSCSSITDSGNGSSVYSYRRSCNIFRESSNSTVSSDCLINDAYSKDESMSSNLSNYSSCGIPNSNSNGFKDIAKSHDERLKDSLDSALFSVLAMTTKHPGPDINTSRSITLKKDDCGGSLNAACAWCKAVNRSVVGEGSNPNRDCIVFYATPCHHLVCRQCLLSWTNGDITCKECGTRFKKKDVVRSH